MSITKHTTYNSNFPGGYEYDFPILPPTKSIVAQDWSDGLQCPYPHAHEVASNDTQPAKKGRKERKSAVRPH